MRFGGISEDCTAASDMCSAAVDNHQQHNNAFLPRSSTGCSMFLAGSLVESDDVSNVHSEHCTHKPFKRRFGSTAAVSRGDFSTHLQVWTSISPAGHQLHEQISAHDVKGWEVHVQLTRPRAGNDRHLVEECHARPFKRSPTSPSRHR